MRTPGRRRFDFLTSGSMDDKMAEFWFPLTIEDKTLTMMGDPVKVGPVVVEKDNHGSLQTIMDARWTAAQASILARRQAIARALWPAQQWPNGFAVGPSSRSRRV
jgi:hypothetical protein